MKSPLKCWFLLCLNLFQFFKWVDEYQAGDANGPRETAHKMMLSSPENLMAFLRSNVSKASVICLKRLDNGFHHFTLVLRLNVLGMNTIQRFILAA